MDDHNNSLSLVYFKVGVLLNFTFKTLQILYKGKKTMEDMKDRYYNLLNGLNNARKNSSVQPFYYDADSERRRKEQLIKLWNRTPEQVHYDSIECSKIIILFSKLINMIITMFIIFSTSPKMHIAIKVKEEEDLRAEIKRIEAKKKERERRANEVQRLINSTDKVTISPEMLIFLNLRLIKTYLDKGYIDVPIRRS